MFRVSDLREIHELYWGSFRMRHTITMLAITLGSGLSAVAHPAPADLSDLALSARLDLPVAGWCRGELQAGHPRAYAIAVTAPSGGGRYLILGSDRTVSELAPFAGRPEITCYTPAAAGALNLEIAESSTVDGQVTVPRTTSIVCAFVENTRATCWQYSPVASEFVKVGEWTT